MKNTKCNVTVTPVDYGTRVRAYVSICIDDHFVINGFRLVDGKKGLFLSSPFKQKPDGTYEDICFSKDKEWRDTLQTVAINKYKEAKNA